jgi:SAM-dependent methyltransferase
MVWLQPKEKTLSEFERWESRFGAPEYIFGKAPNYFLAACKPLLPPAGGRALAVADGEGRNGVWLAEQGLDVLSIDFSPAAQRKAAELAHARGVRIALQRADVHNWTYPDQAFDLVVEIFTQFSAPAERAKKWAGMQRALKRGGRIIIQGYAPKQLQYGTGGPKEIENLYTRAMLMQSFGRFHDIAIVEEEIEMHEGSAHGGMSAVINFAALK